MFLFKDATSKERYVDQYVAFRERNRQRDEFMEHDEVGIISTEYDFTKHDKFKT